MPYRRKFSPLEELVLQLLSEQWYTAQELKRKVWPEHAPEYVTRAIGYLRENELIQALERPHGEDYLEATPLGVEVLADTRHARRPLPCG
jgi:DNA-binding PadR family transcriptional regulator